MPPPLVVAFTRSPPPLVVAFTRPPPPPLLLVAFRGLPLLPPSVAFTWTPNQPYAILLNISSGVSPRIDEPNVPAFSGEGFGDSETPYVGC